MQDNFHQKTKNDCFGKLAFDCTANSFVDCLKIPLAPYFNDQGRIRKYGILTKSASSVSARVHVNTRGADLVRIDYKCLGWVKG